MKINASSPADYIGQLPADRQAPMRKLRKTIRANLPDGFEETMSYGMIGFVVPKSKYPAGYHCDPKLPLPFISIASQKGFVALYHCGIYADSNLLDWFASEYPNHVSTKLNMGKSCIRFKRMDQIPYELIGQLVSRISVAQWIELYEANIKSR